MSNVYDLNAYRQTKKDEIDRYRCNIEQRILDFWAKTAAIMGITLPEEVMVAISNSLDEMSDTDIASFLDYE